MSVLGVGYYSISVTSAGLRAPGKAVAAGSEDITARQIGAARAFEIKVNNINPYDASWKTEMISAFKTGSASRMAEAVKILSVRLELVKELPCALLNRPEFLDMLFDRSFSAFKAITPEQVESMEPGARLAYDKLLADYNGFAKQLAALVPPVTHPKWLCGSVAQKIIDNRNSVSGSVPLTKVALVVYSASDSNYEVNHLAELVEQGYSLVYFEAGKGANWADYLEETGRSAPVQLLVLGCKLFPPRTELSILPGQGLEGNAADQAMRISICDYILTSSAANRRRGAINRANPNGKSKGSAPEAKNSEALRAAIVTEITNMMINLPIDEKSKTALIERKLWRFMTPGSTVLVELCNFDNTESSKILVSLFHDSTVFTSKEGLGRLTYFFGQSGNLAGVLNGTGLNTFQFQKHLPVK